MPVRVTCPTCDARLKAPEGSAGRTVRCPRCTGPVVVPAAPAPPAPVAFRQSEFEPTPTDDGGNPFEDAAAADESGPEDFDGPRRRRRPTAKRRPTPGHNPFAEDPGEEPAAAPPKKRRYRKDADYNPFGDVPEDEEPDPVGEGFEFGIEAPPPAPTGEFDFGPPDPREDDADRRGRP